MVALGGSHTSLDKRLRSKKRQNEPWLAWKKKKVRVRGCTAPLISAYVYSPSALAAATAIHAATTCAAGPRVCYAVHPNSAYTESVFLDELADGMVRAACAIRDAARSGRDGEEILERASYPPRTSFGTTLRDLQLVNEMVRRVEHGAEGVEVCNRGRRG